MNISKFCSKMIVCLYIFSFNFHYILPNLIAPLFCFWAVVLSCTDMPVCVKGETSNHHITYGKSYHMVQYRGNSKTNRVSHRVAPDTQNNLMEKNGQMVSQWVYVENRIPCKASQIARLMGPTWGSPGFCWPQMGPILAPWTLLSELQVRCQVISSHTNGCKKCEIWLPSAGESFNNLRPFNVDEWVGVQMYLFSTRQGIRQIWHC